MRISTTNIKLFFIEICLVLISALLYFNGETIERTALAASDPPCEKPGWFPTEFGLKDHSIFWYDGYYYLISINLPDEINFAYGRSTDLCNWEDLTPTMNGRIPGSWDEFNIWAPYVHFENDIYYLYYTGVTKDFTQSILMATSTNPSDPQSWIPQNMVFQPNHPGMVWIVGQMADCRDPTVIKVGDVYYLYYAGRDISGSIIGLATATSPIGPWTDWGSIVPPEQDAVLESPTIAQHESAYYLFYNRSREGEYYRIGPSPGGPWEEPLPFRPGWAHEIWQNTASEWFTSYLTDLTVTIAPLSWDTTFDPPRPIISYYFFRSYLPVVINH